MAFLFLVEKKTEQEELKLERARDSSEGGSLWAWAEGSALQRLSHKDRDFLFFFLFQAATSTATRHGEALALAGTPSCPRLASSNVPFVSARWVWVPDLPPNLVWPLWVPSVPGHCSEAQRRAWGAGCPVPPMSPVPSLQGTTGEVHCEKVQCPQLTCANPIRASPSDCCKQCPGTCTPLLPSVLPA